MTEYTIGERKADDKSLGILQFKKRDLGVGRANNQEHP